MQLLPYPIEFEWDTGNSDKNLTKHDVTQAESEEIFVNEPFIINEDIKHSTSETRFQALGETTEGRYLFVSFTMRSTKVRIISIRDMNKKEILKYEKHKKV